MKGYPIVENMNLGKA